MRPHRLRVTAFGPFPGTVEVDLDAVSEAGPFLLHGATGAGKTSLLDAIGYALFGKVPGARGLKQLRSDHAADDVRTVVELWATVAGRAVHVVRTPDQRRPRSRGTGWTTDKATVTVQVARDLVALDAGDVESEWSGVQEANAELADLVGMTHEQFVQVVLLPQGDFARFLRAKDDERADVLRALFDTSRFSAVEQHLKRRRDAVAGALAAAAADVTTAAARVAALAGDEEPGAAGADLVEWAQDLLRDSGRDVTAAAEHAAQADTAVGDARAAHHRAVTVVRLLDDVATTARARQALLDQAPAVAAKAVELEAADRAAEVVALHDAATASRSRAGDALLDVQALTGPAADTGDIDEGAGHADIDATPAELVRADLDDLDDLDEEQVAGWSARLDDRHRAAVQDRARLDALAPTVARWHTLRSELAAQHLELAAARAEADAIGARAAGLPGQVDELTAEHERLALTAATADDAVRALARWDALLSQTRRLGELVDQVDAAERADLTARTASRQADDELDRLRQARLDGMSAELAATLVAGEPCGVCGATEHPAPARPTEVAVDAAAERAAKAVAADRTAAAATTGATLARCQATRDEAHARLVADAGTDVEVPDLPGPASTQALTEVLTDRRRAAATTLDTVTLAVTAAERVAARLAALRAEQAETAEALALVESRLVSLTATTDAAAAELERLRADLDGALGLQPEDTDPAVVWTQQVTAATARVDRLHAVVQAVGALAVALAELGRARLAATAACTDAGWPDTAAAVAASRPRAWRDETRTQVEAHGRDLHATAVRLAQLRDELRATTADAGAPDSSDLDVTVAFLADARSQERSCAVRLEQAEARRDEAAAVLARRRGVLEGLQRTVPALLAALRRTGPLRAEAEAARALADLCSGSNDKGIPLSTYVLAAHLEHVVEAANQRLHGMSDGRYALVHVEEGEDRRRRAGLGLAVLDAWTGRQRPAGTLSGGETFLASLALALGLADVVTAEAGGVRIDALFVDEGFGTLDPDSLDRAMDVLDQLQEHGRMVGVVSHVGELRQRLPRQIRVVHGRDGSTVRVDADGLDVA